MNNNRRKEVLQLYPLGWKRGGRREAIECSLRNRRQDSQSLKPAPSAIGGDASLEMGCPILRSVGENDRASRELYLGPDFAVARGAPGTIEPRAVQPRFLMQRRRGCEIFI